MGREDEGRRADRAPRAPGQSPAGPSVRALPPLRVQSTSWRLLRGGRPVLSARHLAILEAVRDLGSLNAGAKHLRISYRDAWEKIREAEAGTGLHLVAARTGGRHGGGSRLTATGEELVARLRAFETEQRRAAERSAALYFGAPPPTPSSAPRRSERVLLATTTSAVDSGLLSALLGPFTRRTGIEVEVAAVGSGAALRLAAEGRADAVLAHAPAAEERTVRAGHLVNRRAVMQNEFVLLGPPEDPARVRGARDAADALRRIAASGCLFLSRADGSGTHQRERQLLQAAGTARTAPWYRRGRTGMAELLRRADEARAYVLADRGTFAALAAGLSLEVLHAGDRRLANPYSILATDPYRHPAASYLAAMELVAWLTSPPAQEIIAGYRIAGRQLAEPAAAPSRGKAPAPLIRRRSRARGRAHGSPKT